MKKRPTLFKILGIAGLAVIIFITMLASALPFSTQSAGEISDSELLIPAASASASDVHADSLHMGIFCPNEKGR